MTHSAKRYQHAAQTTTAVGTCQNRRGSVSAAGRHDASALDRSRPALVKCFELIGVRRLSAAASRLDLERGSILGELTVTGGLALVDHERGERVRRIVGAERRHRGVGELD